jgi:hypothetical protein
MDYGYADEPPTSTDREIVRQLQHRVEALLVGGLVAIVVLFAWDVAEQRGWVPAPGIPMVYEMAPRPATPAR